MPQKQYGYLCEKYCGVRLELQVLQSAAGYYIGCWSNTEGPMSRESREYYGTRAEAATALQDGTFTQREHP